MSSAINHKKRSRRGYKMQTHLAPKNTPLISRYQYERRKTFREVMAKLFQRMTGIAD